MARLASKNTARPAHVPESRQRRGLALTTALGVAIVFAPLAGYPLLNWDDPAVLTSNEALRGEGVVRWAFTTTFMEHYQPLAWLTWAALARTIGLTAAAAHGLNVALHAACAGLVALLGVRLLEGVRRDTRHESGRLRDTAAVAIAAASAASIFALHPLRVEPVAWASAMPYSLALLFALLATLTWIDRRPVLSAVLFGASLLSRPVALGLPLVLALLPLEPRAPWRARLWRLAPHAVLAVAAAAAESSARLTATMTEFGIGPRLTLAAGAPFVYLGRTLAPLDLTPLDVLPRAPQTDVRVIVSGLAGLVVISILLWRVRQRWPWAALAWIAYLALLVPALGLVPSGLQATADRYSYLPAVPVSIALGILIGSARPAVRVLALAVVLALAAATWQQMQHWRDSIALWTRAVTLDERNDIALYNLGAALAEAGRRPEAIARYDQVLVLVPDHPQAQRNRALLQAAALEEEGNRLASSGQLTQAIERYREAVAHDDRRTHSHAALGMALMESGRLDEALPHLRTAVDLGSDEPAVPNALAYLLVQAGRRAEAIAVLREARRRHPDDPNIARNLAHLEGQ